jgi:hypothetical protein
LSGNTVYSPAEGKGETKKRKRLEEPTTVTVIFLIAVVAKRQCKAVTTNIQLNALKSLIEECFDEFVGLQSPVGTPFSVMP